MGFSAKLFEVVLYPESYDMNRIMDDLGAGGIKDWAYIIHDKDGKKEHVHIAIRTTDSRDSVNVAKWFNLSENAISKVKGRWKDVLKYLTHKNAPQKYQYNDDEVISNFDWKKEIEKGNDKVKLDEIIEGISSGRIREYNYTDSISDKDFIKFKKTIDNAFIYRKDRIRREKREMESIYITGDSGTGKTTYAKMVCEENNYSYFISSGSNDVLDGYMGEDVIILDDMRPSCMGLSDLLKMLDNHTASTVKSRYKNKVLECRMIIITSILPIDTFFHNVFAEEKEPIIQLKRRCKTYIRMYLSTMDIFQYDDDIRDYDEGITAKNPIYNKFNRIPIDKKTKLDKLKSLLGNIEIEEITGNVLEYEEKETIKRIFGVQASLLDEEKRIK